MAIRLQIKGLLETKKSANKVLLEEDVKCFIVIQIVFMYFILSISFGSIRAGENKGNDLILILQIL